MLTQMPGMPISGTKITCDACSGCRSPGRSEHGATGPNHTNETCRPNFPRSYSDCACCVGGCSWSPHHLSHRNPRRCPRTSRRRLSPIAKRMNRKNAHRLRPSRRRESVGPSSCRCQHRYSPRPHPLETPFPPARQRKTCHRLTRRGCCRSNR